MLKLSGICMPGSNSQEKDVFDEMIITIETTSFDLQLMLGHFVGGILELFEEQKVDLEVSFPIWEDGKYITCLSRDIFFDENKDLVFISLSGSESKIQWSSLTIHSMERFAAELHMKYVAQKKYFEFSGVSFDSKLH